jgi:hypothetical protein
MIDLVYPWRWLSDSVGTSFVLRYPWIDATREAVGREQAVCVLLPEVAGRLGDWGEWMAERIDGGGSTRCLSTAGEFREVSGVLADSYQVGERFEGGRPADWTRQFLAESRREMPHIETVPLLVTDADDDCAAALQDLLQAQRDLGYPFARPVLLRRTIPPEWNGVVVRFGLPEWVGDLNRIDPPPDRDPVFWTNLVLALTVAWETGATPHLAAELWDVLRLRRTMSLRDSSFDTWLERELDGFARRNRTALAVALPLDLAFGPVPSLGEDEPWQRGAVAWECEAFDVTPLRARLWAADLSDDDARDALRRRRLTNVPLARWLSAWAASVEESLRVAVLRAGSRNFRSFLETQPPRQQQDGFFRSRLDELGPEEGVFIVDRADFGDLADYLATKLPKSSFHNPARLLELCRLARNRVVHQRLVSTSDFLHIANTACWLDRGGKKGRH